MKLRRVQKKNNKKSQQREVKKSRVVFGSRKKKKENDETSRVIPVKFGRNWCHFFVSLPKFGQVFDRLYFAD